MNRCPFPAKCLAVALVLVLLTVRLGCFTEEAFVKPVEDCLFGSAFIAADAEGRGKLPVFLKSQALFIWDLAGEPLPPVILQESSVAPALPPVLLLFSFPEDIFIPPESSAAGLTG